MHKQGLQYVYKCTYVAAVGGLLFGYDTAVVAGAIGFIEQKYGLSPAMVGWVASCALVGCVIGAMFAGSLSDKIGRKKVLMISAFAFAISSLGIMLPFGLNAFIAFRLIGGIGIGIASMLSPLYISEIAPANIRGRLISIYQMGIVLGILLIYFVNAWIAGLHNDAWNIESGWRWMFGSGLLPSILFIVLLLNVPESPRWLAQQNRLGEAEAILAKVNGTEKAKEELASIKAAMKEDTATSFGALLKPGLRYVLMIGIFLAILSQVTGINAIMYYAPEIFKSSGDGSSSALMQTVLVGVINTLFTIVAIRYVDKWGRKTLLLIGAAGMTICLGLVGAAFHFGITQGSMVLVSILAYIAFFAISLGPLTFVVVAEIFPTHVRGRAMSVAIFFLWAAVFVVSQTFPMLKSAFGPAPTFWIYMVMSIIAFFFVWRMVPETKEKSLEEIEQFWKNKQ
ncbi:sugar porter family MFS transporter [Pseudoflavitalea sp. G-6-1-2]|uniref:sugar porter family MFS transporter n=1 Tax=Pseudoflavitalea sp. G-6-1-2 TaxID=2728841 RepID=UPI00146DE057|nr:sugar porter family MFS transporter [Pseudoflavitalea sp. G-6-1-2]NML21721.1 sugar porter family MFS transporter [Pseudoflavitalea sp. G-6-1-2]